MKIVTVIPLAKSAFKEDLTYFTAKEIPDGSIVQIPIRNKKVLGIAISSEEVSASKSNIKNMAFNLKKIEEVKERSIFSSEFIKTGIELAQYFCAQKGTTLVTLIPASFRENYDKLSSAETSIVSEKNSSKKIRAEKLLLQLPIDERISYYKTLIRSSFAEKKSVFMVLPSERDIDTFKDLSRGIENFTFAIHSGLSAKKQVEQFKKIVNTGHPVLIFGTAQFLSINRHDMGTIIVEHESAGSYKMFNRPYLDMRIFTELFAQKIGAKLILADTLLRFETIARRDELSEIHALSFRLNFKGNIEITNPNIDKDPASDGASKKFRIFSDETLDEIKGAVSKKQNVFIFSLRKGLATMTVCRDCATPVMCDNCSSPVVLYLSRDGKKRMFICNRCGTEKSPEIKCANCDSWNLMPLGIGTDTAEEAIRESSKKHFPKVNIFKIDKESAKTEKGAEKIIKEFEESNGAILIGTEMTFFYLKDKVPLSIIASFDSLWSIPNFKMSEKMLHIIFSMITLTEKKLIIQTKNTDDPALKAIVNENLLGFVREELKDRKDLGYPPFERFIKISHLGNSEETTKAKKGLAEVFKEYRPEIFSGFVAKLKGKYATNALIKLPPLKWSLPELHKEGSIDQVLLQKLLSLPPIFSINVDPEDLL
jgi:primosomal protein N' (replication factor Y)